MATNVSSLRVAIRGDVSGLETSLQQGQKSVVAFSQSMERSQRSIQAATSSGSGIFGGAGGRTSMIISQLGFAAEDAASQFGTMGLAGALRASGNNLSFVASMLNPMAGAFVGIGTALAAIVVPRLFETTKKVEGLDEAFRKLGHTTRSVQTDLEHSLRNIQLGAPDVEPAVELDENRFQAQRKVFSKEVKQLTGDIQNLKDQAKNATSGTLLDAMNLFDESGLSKWDTVRKEAERLEVGIPGRLQRAFDTAVGTGNVGAIRDEMESIRKDLMKVERSSRTGIAGGAISFDQETLKGLVEQADGLGKIAQEAVEAKGRSDQLNKSLKQLGENEAEAERRKQAGKLLSPLADAGAGIVEGVWRDLLTGAKQRDQFKAIAKEQKEERRRRTPQGLAGGFEFGSREAVSTLNRAMFRNIGEKKEEKEIAKNTHGTEVAVRDVVRAVRDLGSQFLPALPGDAL